MTGLDGETRDAVAALVHRLRNRGGGDGQFAAADEAFAAEYVGALGSRGWYPVAVPPPGAGGEAGAREAARELLALACATRPDWSAEETWNAVHAAKTAGLGWDRLVLRLMAIALRAEDPPTRPRELWDFARGITSKAAGRPPPAEHVTAAVTALLAGDYATAWTATHDGAVPPQAARAAGPQQVLDEAPGRDP